MLWGPDKVYLYLTLILLSIEILSGPNKVYLYLTLTLHNFTSPKNLHSSNIPRCVSSLFGQFLLSMGFSCNKLLLSFSFKYPRVILQLLNFKAKIFVA